MASTPQFKLPPGFTEAAAPEPAPEPTSFPSATIPTGTPEFTPPAAPQFSLPPGFEQVGYTPPLEEGYFKQVKDRVTGMAAEMYDAWEKGDFPRLTGIPQAIMGLNKQAYDDLPNSKTPSEFLLNIVPIFGPVLNRAAAHAGQGKPRTAAAELTTDILLPLLAEKLPGAVWDTLPSSATANIPTRLMTSALKPTISKFEKAARASEQAVQTGIELGIPVSEGGFRKLTNTIRRMNQRRDVFFAQAPKPEMVLTPKTPQRALPQGGAPDFELGPTVPPPGTKQTVLSHARGVVTEPAAAANLGEYMGGLRESFTAESTKPGVVRLKLEQAGNQQLVQEINRRAQESGLLDAVQDAARKANQPVPFDISEVFNISFKNVIDPKTSKNIATRIEQLKKRFRTVNPEADFAAIDAATDEFFRNYPVPMSYKQAQAVRAATSQKLQSKAYLAQRNPASVAAEVELERGIMDDLKAAIPELKALNPQEAKALGLLPELRRALARTKNWEVWSGIQAGTAAVVGGTLGGYFGGHGTEAASAAAIIAMALRDPMVKSKLAIAINRAQKLFPDKYGAPSMATAGAKLDQYTSAFERAAVGSLPALKSEIEEEPQP